MATEEESVVIKYQISGAKDVAAGQKSIKDTATAAKMAVYELQQGLSVPVKANLAQVAKQEFANVQSLATTARNALNTMKAERDAFFASAGKQEANAIKSQTAAARDALKSQQAERAAFFSASAKQEEAAVKAQVARIKEGIKQQQSLIAENAAFAKEEATLQKAALKEKADVRAAFDKEQNAALKATQKAQTDLDTAFGKELTARAKATAEAREEIEDAFHKEQTAKAKAYHRGYLEEQAAFGKAATAQAAATARAQVAAAQAIRAPLNFALFVRGAQAQNVAQGAASNAALAGAFSASSIATARARQAAAAAPPPAVPAASLRSQLVTGAPRLGLAGSVVGAYFGVTAVKEIGSLADKFLELRNRVRLVTDTMVQAKGVTKELGEISIATRSSLDATGQLYQRLTTASSGLSLTNGQILQLTESITQAAVIGGSNALETEKGLFQLSQGLARGVLRGDELRSILEQLPGVADVLAAHFKVSRGELSKLGEQGKISAKEIATAFLQARDNLAEKFSTLTPTIGQAFQGVRNQMILFFGEVNEKSGVLDTIARSVQVFGNNLETVARVVVAGTVVKALRLMAGALAALKFSENATLIGRVFHVTVLAVGALAAFGDKIKPFGGKATVFDYIATSFERIADAINSIKFPQLPDWMSGGGVAGGGFGPNAPFGLGAPQSSGGGGFGAAALPFPLNLFSGGTPAAEARASNREFEAKYAADKEKAQLERFKTSGVNSPYGTGGGGAGGAGSGSNRRTFGDIYSDLAEQLAVLKEQSRERQTLAGLARAERSLGREIVGPEREKLVLLLQQVQAQKESNSLADFKRDNKRTRQLARLRGDDADVQGNLNAFADDNKINVKDIKEKDRKTIDNQTRLTNETTRYEEVLRSLGPTQKEFAAEQRAIAKAYDAGELSLRQYLIRMDDLQLKQLAGKTDFKSGIQRGLLEVDKSLQDVATSASGIVVDAFGQATDAILEFAKTGKLSVTDLVTDILSQVARLAIEQSITKPLANALGTALGNWFSGGTTNPAGGTTWASQSGSGIDAGGGNDTFSGVPGNLRYMDTGSQGSAGNQAPMVIVENINYADNTKSEVTQSTGSNGEAMIKVITRAVQAQEAEDFQYRTPPHLRQLGLTRQGVHR